MLQYKIDNCPSGRKNAILTKEKKMKRKIFVILLALCLLFLTSCDLQGPLESLSNMLYEAATNIGGNFLKETTFTPAPPPPESESTESESAEPESTEPESTESTESESDELPSLPDQPEPEPEPEPEPLPERNPTSFDAMMGTTVDFPLPNNSTDVKYGDLYNVLSNQYFSFVRIHKNFSEGIYTDGNGQSYELNEGLALIIAGIQYSSDTSLLLDIKFDQYVEQAQGEVVATVSKDEIFALSDGFEGAVYLPLKDSLYSAGFATNEGGFTNAKTAISTVISATVNALDGLEGEELTARLEAIAAEIVTAKSALGASNPFVESTASVAQKLYDICASLASDGAKVESASSALNVYLGKLTEKIDEYKNFILFATQEPKKSYHDLAKEIFLYEYNYSGRYSGNLSRIELGRHPEKSLTAQQYAKLISLVYDGDGKGESGIGIVTDRDDAKVIFGALESPDMYFVAQTMQALKALRPSSQPLFVGAFNTESFIESSMTPESAYLSADSKLAELVEYRDELYSHVEMYVSGFGYNTVDTSSPYYASEKMQADYMLRSLLIFSRLGIDRASAAQLKDFEGDEFNGFGIIRSDNTPKIAYNYLNTARELLEGYTFKSVIEGEHGAMVYDFEKGDSHIIAVWNPAGDGSSAIEDVKIFVGEEDIATLCTLNASEIGASSSELESLDGWVSVSAECTPKFIVLTAPAAE